MVHAAPGAHRRLLDRAQPRERLAGVPDARRRSRGLDEPAGERRHPRQMAQEVERGALAGEERAQAAPTPRRAWRRGRPPRRRRPTNAPRPEGRAARTPRSRTRCRRSRLPTRATTSTVAVTSAGTSAAVRSPSGPMSSASARGHQRPHHVHRRVESLIRPGPRPGHSSRRLVLGGERHELGRWCTGERPDVRGTRPTAPGGPAGCASRETRDAWSRRGRGRCSPRGGSRSRRRSGRARRVRQPARSRLFALRSTPASRVITRCSSSRIAGPGRCRDAARHRDRLGQRGAAQHAGGIGSGPGRRRWPRPRARRTRAPRAASSTPGGWHRGRRCTPPRRTPTGPGGSWRRRGRCTTPPER